MFQRQLFTMCANPNKITSTDNSPQINCPFPLANMMLMICDLSRLSLKKVALHKCWATKGPSWMKISDWLGGFPIKFYVLGWKHIKVLA